MWKRFFYTSIFITLSFVTGCKISAYKENGKTYLKGYGAKEVQYYSDGTVKSLSKHAPIVDMPNLKVNN